MGVRVLDTGLSVAILAYNEEENLRILIPDIIKYVEQLHTEYEILVIDSEKPLDNTADVCRALGCKYINQYYPKFGGAFRTAIECATYDKFLILDADGSHPPHYIPELYRKFCDDNCDVVIGSRYCGGGGTHDALISIAMSRILNTVFRIALGIKAHDISTDFRIYQTDLLKKVTLEKQNYDILQEVLLKIKLANNDRLNVKEVPITFEKRMYGESKRQLIPFIVSYIKSLIKLLFLRFSFLRNFLLYACIGVGGMMVDFLTFALLQYHSSPVEIANVIGGISGFLFTFSFNTFLNFKKTDKLLKRIFSYGLICLCGTLFSTIMINLLKDTINIYLLKFALMMIVAMGQFILNKMITYR